MKAVRDGILFLLPDALRNIQKSGVIERWNDEGRQRRNFILTSGCPAEHPEEREYVGTGDPAEHVRQ